MELSDASQTEGEVAPPNLGNLAVKITVVGRASRRWLGAKTAAEADRLNQVLSEQRAKNIHSAVERILRSALPGSTIPTMWRAVGSHDGFPTVGDDNAPVDRSVVVMVDLTTTTPGYKFQHQPPRKIYAPSKVWTLRVRDIATGAAALGFVSIFLRLSLTNPYTGKDIIMSGWLQGGGSATDLKDSFRLPTGPSLLGDLANMYRGQVGSSVIFCTEEAMDFDDWAEGGGRTVRFEKIDVALGLRSYGSILVFTDLKTSPKELVFEHKFLTVGKIKADAFIVAGKLHIQGGNPGDYLELPSPDAIIPTQSIHDYQQGLLLTFPTGKADIHDLTEKDLQNLRKFVVNKAQAISALSNSFKVTN
jgi:hypothetical protein